MFNQRLQPFAQVANFFGVNSKDTFPNMNDGEWHKDSINVMSDPQGALTSRLGFSAITVASVGAINDWCGFFEYQKHSGGSTTKSYVGGAANGWVYNYVGGLYTVIGKGFSTTADDDKRYNFFTLENVLTVIPGAGDWPCIWTGSGSIVSHISSVTADWGMEWQRYGWLHSTVDPRLLYYTASIGSPGDSYTSFLNFDDDGEPLTGGGKQGDDLILGKEHALHRVQFRGTEPLFKKYRLPAKIGPINFESCKTLPDGSLMFLATDCNFYMLQGDTPIPVGDNIQGYIKEGVFARLKYAVAGVNYKRSQYWCSFTYTSGATQNDRTVVMDWSRPYQDVWGRTQYPWFIYSISSNCFAEVTISGENLLYHGGYDGKVYKDDTGTNDNGAAFATFYRSKVFNFGDLTIEKKFPFIEFSYENKGDWDLNIGFMADENPATQKIITQNMQSGIETSSPRWDYVTWDNFSWAEESDSNKSRHIDLQGKTLYVTMATQNVDEAWNMYWYVLHARPLFRTARKRES
jgi:hypothetical protein